MTLTTEQLRERIGHLKERLHGMKQHKYPDDCPNAKAYLESLKAERQQDIALLEELLANREAQPVAGTQFKPVADLFALGWENGEVCSFITDADKAFYWLTGYTGTCVQEYVKLERLQEAYTAPPAVPNIFNKLIAHLNNAHNFIENTEAFGVAAASGIIECGDATWNIDASKAVLEKCRAAMLAGSQGGDL